MSHCKSCNRLLDDQTLNMKQMDGSPEDMCGHCRYKSTVQYNILSDKEYNHAAVTGDAPSPSDSYYYDYHYN